MRKILFAVLITVICGAWITAQQQAELAPIVTYATVMRADTFVHGASNIIHGQLLLQGDDGSVFEIQLHHPQALVWTGLHARIEYRQARDSSGANVFCSWNGQPDWVITLVKKLPDRPCR